MATVFTILYGISVTNITVYHSTKYKCKGVATFNRVKVNIFTNQNESLMKQIQNCQKSIGKSIPAYGFLKSREKMCKPKIYRLLPNLCDLHTKIHRLAYRF
jgi:hypothetical protein